MLLVLKILWLFLNILQIRIALVQCEAINYQSNNHKAKRSFQPVDDTFEPFGNSELDSTLFVESATDDDLTDFGLTEVVDNDNDIFKNEEFVGDSTTARFEIDAVKSNILEAWLNEEEQNRTFQSEAKDLQYLEENLSFVKLEKGSKEVAEKEAQEITTTTVEKIAFESNGQILNLTVIEASTEGANPTTMASPEVSTFKASYEQNHLVSNQHFFGNARYRNGMSCISLNLTVSIDYMEIPLNLGSDVVINGGCDPRNAFVEFKWLTIESFGNLTANFGVICEENLCYVNDIFIIKTGHFNGSKSCTERNYVKIFVTEPGLVYQNETPVSLDIGKVFKVQFGDVKFYVSENLNESKTYLDVSNISEYYSKLLGSIVGFLLLILFTTYLVYFVRKWRKANDEKKEFAST